jgi:hypothetical protein
MSITTYAELKTSVKNWLKRGTDLDSYIDDIITLGEKRIYRELRVRPMETALSVTLSSGQAAIPSDFVELKYAYIDGSPVQYLQMREAAWIIENYPTRSATSKPKFLAQDGDYFIFGPFADSTYTLKGTYFKRLDPLSSATNTLFTKNPDLYLMASLAESAVFLGYEDARVARWEAKYLDIQGRIQAENDKGRLSGTLTMAVG